MKYLYFIFFILFFSYTTSIPLQQKKKCKIDISVNNVNNVNNVKSKIDISENRIERIERIDYFTLLFDVKFVVFHNNDEGKVSKDNLVEQVDVLNKAFSGFYTDSNSDSMINSMIDSKFRFRLDTIEYINNKAYYNNCDSIDSSLMGKYTRKTDSRINVIVCYSDFYLGWAYYPWYFEEKSRYNTVFIHKNTIPDGDLEFYNKGMTLVHEIGHFFGLYHTFASNGICDNGDQVFDTPAEKTPSFECNKKRDTCPDIPGKDPVTNFMDYSPDDCVTEFSLGQINRMWDSIDKYKPNLKRVSRDNFLREYQEAGEYVNLGNGQCDITDKNIQLQIFRFRNKHKTHITRDQCERKTIYYIAQAYTYTSKKNAKNKLKYNCIIYKVNSVKDIQNIKSYIDKKKRYKNSNCYALKNKK